MILQEREVIYSHRRKKNLIAGKYERRKKMQDISRMPQNINEKEFFAAFSPAERTEDVSENETEDNEESVDNIGVSPESALPEAERNDVEAMEEIINEDTELSAATLVREIFQNHYKNNEYETLMCIEAVLQDHEVIDTHWKHTSFLKKMVEWGCLPEIKNMRQYGQRISRELKKIEMYKNNGYRSWGVSARLFKEKCMKMGKILEITFPYSRVDKDDD